MSKKDLKFLDVTHFSFIKAKKEKYLSFDGGKEVIKIEIKGFNGENSYWVNLDKSTAIKFAKTLRTEINKIKEVSHV
jgi:hypothetical protein